jgi:hypothetical protein
MNKEISLELANKIASKCDLIKYKVDYASFTRVGDANNFIKYHKNMLSEDSYKVTGDYGDYSCYVTTNDYDKLPSIADVVMWLYEKYGIWVSINSNKENKFSINIYKKNENQYIKGIEVDGIELRKIEYYNIPTDAYEAAIEYVLNLK